jgi:F420-non-reducing hydrogenase small subunit
VTEGILNLPAFFDRVRTLPQVTKVDFIIPGCPPESHQIWNVIEAVIGGAELPPAGSVIGAGKAPVCEECDRLKDEKRIQGFHRNWEITPEPEKCLLEQGLICMGIATRSGCGAPCPQANMPCTGCYGPPEGVADQGAAMIAALGSILDIGDCKGKSEAEIAARVEAILDSVPDYAGTFYKYSLPGSILGGRIKA